MTGLPVSSLSQRKTTSHFSPATVNLNFFSSDFLLPVLAASLPGWTALTGRAAPTQMAPTPRRIRTAGVMPSGLAARDRMFVPTPSVAEKDESARTATDGDRREVHCTPGRRADPEIQRRYPALHT